MVPVRLSPSAPLVTIQIYSHNIHATLITNKPYMYLHCLLALVDPGSLQGENIFSLYTNYKAHADMFNIVGWVKVRDA